MSASNLMTTSALVPANAGRYTLFRNFLWKVWKHLGLPAPTPIQYDIAEALQYGDDRLVIEAFRGEGKSWITAAYVVWRLYMNPQVEFLVVSASKDRADNFSIFTKRLISEIPMLAHLQARPGQRDSNIQFDVGPHKAAHAPSVKSAGITGQITGSRADEIIADDVEVPNNSATQAMRLKLSDQVKEFESIVKPGGKIRFLGTPQTIESIYNQLPSRGYTVMVWTARVPTAEQARKYGPHLAPIIRKMMEERPAGSPTDPTRFTDDDLLKREMSIGRSTFSLQFMLDTTMSDANRYPLKLADLMFMDLDPERAPVRFSWARSPDKVLNDAPNFGFSGDLCYRPMWIDETFAEYTGRAMWIDPSGRGKDETGYAVVYMLHGYLFLMDWGGFIGGYDDATLEGLSAVAKKWKVTKIDIEDNFGNGMFSELFKPVLKRHHDVTIENLTSSGQKEKRIIDTLEPVMNRHKLIVNLSLLQKDYDTSIGAQETLGESAANYSGFWQLTHITSDRGALRRDDRVEALAGAVGHFSSRMAQDEDKQKKALEERLMDAELKKFIKAAGGNVRGPSLISRNRGARR